MREHKQHKLSFNPYLEKLYKSDKPLIIYKMKKLKLEDLKEWRVIGIVIDGIDLVSIYRKQFASLVKENDDNLDLAISSWSIDEESITLDE